MNDKLMNEILTNILAENGTRIANMNKFFNYYKGDHDILREGETGTGKPDNKLVYNFAELIIDTNHSYLFSKPQSYDFKHRQESWIKKVFSKDKAESLSEEFLDDVRVIYFDNNEESTTSTLGKKAAISGEAVELHWIDTDGNIKFTETDAREWFSFTFEKTEYWGRKITKEDYVAKGQSYEKVKKEMVELYTKENIFEYEKQESGYVLVNEQQHFYGEIPAIKFANGDYVNGITTSDLKNVIALNDAYNFANSAALNNLQYNGDPYLLLKGFSFSDEQIENLKSARVIELIDKDMDVNFLQWNHETNAYEVFLDRLERLIFVLSFTPDLFSKEGLSSDSGVSLKMKFIGADLKADQKIRSFIAGFRKRLRLIAKQLENKTNKSYHTDGIYRSIEVSFNKNMPQNLKETVEMVQGLIGSVSDETRVKLLPFIENASDEVEKMKQDQGLSTSGLFGDDEK